MTNGNRGFTLFKDCTMASTMHVEEAGSSSGDDYLELHSPADSSEDSVEVKVSAIKISNKRKSDERQKFSGPLKKRMCLKVKEQEKELKSLSTPFRPWSLQQAAAVKLEPPSPAQTISCFRPPSPIQQQTEPVSLVVIKREEDVRVPHHPQITELSTAETENMILKTNERFPQLHVPEHQSKRSPEALLKREQRNYKNMTRERRIEANARERTRVHTISAAFDTLRRAVPAYSHNQKLSKLSVLRIACSYIMTLSNLMQDASEDEPGQSISECVDLVSKTIQREGKLRKKKDDND